MTFDPVALEQQLALLQPVAVRLRSESRTPELLGSGDWRGPAAEAFAVAGAEVVDRARVAAAETEAVVRRLRAARSGTP